MSFDKTVGNLTLIPIKQIGRTMRSCQVVKGSEPPFRAPTAAPFLLQLARTRSRRNSFAGGFVEPLREGLVVQAGKTLLTE